MSAAPAVPVLAQHADAQKALDLAAAVLLHARPPQAKLFAPAQTTATAAQAAMMMDTFFLMQVSSQSSCVDSIPQYTQSEPKEFQM
jgi:hypothetical protein